MLSTVFILYTKNSVRDGGYCGGGFNWSHSYLRVFKYEKEEMSFDWCKKYLARLLILFRILISSVTLRKLCNLAQSSLLICKMGVTILLNS